MRSKNHSAVRPRGQTAGVSQCLHSPFAKPPYKVVSQRQFILGIPEPKSSPVPMFSSIVPENPEQSTAPHLLVGHRVDCSWSNWSHCNNVRQARSSVLAKEIKDKKHTHTLFESHQHPSTLEHQWTSPSEVPASPSSPHPSTAPCMQLVSHHTDENTPPPPDSVSYAQQTQGLSAVTHPQTVVAAREDRHLSSRVPQASLFAHGGMLADSACSGAYTGGRPIGRRRWRGPRRDWRNPRRALEDVWHHDQDRELRGWQPARSRFDKEGDGRGIGCVWRAGPIGWERWSVGLFSWTGWWVDLVKPLNLKGGPNCV